MYNMPDETVLKRMKNLNGFEKNSRWVLCFNSLLQVFLNKSFMLNRNLPLFLVECVPSLTKKSFLSLRNGLLAEDANTTISLESNLVESMRHTCPFQNNLGGKGEIP